eukprot:TRINITY_DN5085_c0_g1_i1.p1 TRINITY_DN5085_c0_g1~~TRINITY_DN5085_c0_g1_i1.p1  ORF type:complete len:207 (+),score=55.90 TRINITY_DN5085_c0_g1_i1:72-623(+)
METSSPYIAATNVSAAPPDARVALLEAKMQAMERMLQDQAAQSSHMHDILSSMGKYADGADSVPITSDLEDISLKEKDMMMMAKHQQDEQARATLQLRVETDIRIKELELWIKTRMLDLTNFIMQEMARRDAGTLTQEENKQSVKKLETVVQLVNMMIADQNQVERRLQNFGQVLGSIPISSR